MDNLQIGRIVHYVPWPFETSHGNPEHKAAIVVSIFGLEPMANLTVFMDWMNDGIQYYDNGRPPCLWATSRKYSELKEPGTWHWLEKE